MDWKTDSRACLDVADIMISDIEDMIQETLKHDDLVPYLKVKIKNCLENIRSPLDYVANYIFDTYCKMEYTAKELKNLKTYYPIAPNEGLFDRSIKERYRMLISKRPDVVGLFKDSQPFEKSEWLKHLTKLINENKHRTLTRQTSEKTTHIKSGLVGGSILDNITINVSGSPLIIRGTPVDFINPTPYDHMFNAATSIEYFFDELSLSVIPTLKGIYTGASDTLALMESVI